MKIQDIIPGTPVIYWSIIKVNGEKYNAMTSEIISVPWEISGGMIVCKIRGVSGCVSIKHLEPIEQLIPKKS